MLRKAVDRFLKRYEGIFMFFRLLSPRTVGSSSITRR